MVPADAFRRLLQFWQIVGLRNVDAVVWPSESTAATGVQLFFEPAAALENHDVDEVERSRRVASVHPHVHGRFADAFPMPSVLGPT